MANCKVDFKPKFIEYDSITAYGTLSSSSNIDVFVIFVFFIKEI